MATYKKNALTKSVSGSFGNEFQFRQVDGKTIIVPVPRRPAVWSEEQIAVRKRFLNATLYAKAATANPLMKEEYAAIAKHKHLKAAMVAAITDFLTPTKLSIAYAHQFEGTMNFPITIVLADNYKGKEMTVSVSNKDGTHIESGKANFTFGDSAWHYTTTVPYESIDGVKVLVTVKDRIGRVTTFEKMLNSME